MPSPTNANYKNSAAQSTARSYPLLLLAIYAAAWIGLAITPLDRSDWMLENVLPLLTLPLLVYAYRRRLLSNFCYTLLFIFLCLHAIGAHYTYAKVPYDDWARSLGGFSVNELFGLQRNAFDRLVHFLYGLLLFPIFWQLFAARIEPSAAGNPNTLRYVLVAAFLMAHAGIYETIEWLAAASFGGDLGTAYLGTQGDEWDAQKDMALAYAGTAVAILISLTYRRMHGRRPAA